MSIIRFPRVKANIIYWQIPRIDCRPGRRLARNRGASAKLSGADGVSCFGQAMRCPMNFRQACVCVLLGLGLPAGCEGPANTVTSTPPKPVMDVSEVILEINPPVPLNLDDRPGPDGLRARVYFAQKGDLPVTVSGSLDMLLYELDASKPMEQTLQDEPFKTWSLTPADLNWAMGRTLIGWGYELPLLWGAQAPRTGKIMLRARYCSPTGQTVLSAPVVIEMPGN
jgi:hypothetical protein